MLNDSWMHNYLLLMLHIWSLHMLFAPLCEAFRQEKLVQRLATPPEVNWHFLCDFGVVVLFTLHLLLWAHESNQSTGLYTYILGYMYAWTVVAVLWARFRYTSTTSNTSDNQS